MTKPAHTVIVTGAAGFIGSALCRYLRGNNLARVIGIDKMTYAASREALATLGHDPYFDLIEADICNATRMGSLIGRSQPDGVIHLAAETHVDRSIDRPDEFIQANIFGTYTLLEAVRSYMPSLPENKRNGFRFLHVSTDEVYGSLDEAGQFDEMAAYAPNSPYAASKAAADHLMRAWHKTYGVPVIVSNGSNNYGPFQFPEKLIPLMIVKALNGEPMPVYGNGLNTRDWLYVEDHAEALYLTYSKGRVGEKYHVGGGAEWRNIDLIHRICDIIDELQPGRKPCRDLIEFVADRPAHDRRYAMDFSKLQTELGWSPRTPFEKGLRKTVEWYLENHEWRDDVCDRASDGEEPGTPYAKQYA